jgi:hypothetical protein
MARELRAYLIIDCCFAAALQHGFLSSPLGLAERRLDEALPDPSVFDTDDEVPTSGVALLAASGLNDPASAPPNEPYTRFTAALLEVLRDGNERFPPELSLSDLHQLVDQRIKQKFHDESRPELRSLQQTRGRVELVRLFANPAARLAGEKHKAEERAWLATETRKIEEAARLAEERRKADEAARHVEEMRQADEVARLAEDQRKAEEARLAEEKRRVEEAARLAEEKRKADGEPPRASVADDAITQFCGAIRDSVQQLLPKDSAPNSASRHALKYPGWGRQYKLWNKTHLFNADFDPSDPAFYYVVLFPDKRGTDHNCEIKLVWERAGIRECFGNKGIAATITQVRDSISRLAKAQLGSFTVYEGRDVELSVPKLYTLTTEEVSDASLLIKTFVSGFEPMLLSRASEIRNAQVKLRGIYQTEMESLMESQRELFRVLDVIRELNARMGWIPRKQIARKLRMTEDTLAPYITALEADGSVTLRGDNVTPTRYRLNVQPTRKSRP